ncbi:MAG: dicarboxylate/amino acid:cation symporter [Acidobacteriota bacterium]
MAEAARDPCPPSPVAERGWWGSPWTALGALALGIVCGLALNPTSGLARAAPGAVAAVLGTADLAANLFLRLLKMLVAPLVLFSLVSGVASIADPRRLGRLGARTFAYYIATSMLAVLTGLVLVNLIGPGRGARLPMEQRPEALPGQAIGVRELIEGLVPDNIFAALAQLDMLPIITFSLLVGWALTRLDPERRRVLTRLFDAGFHLFTRLALMVLATLPVAVFALILRVAARAELRVFGDLALYVLTVALALAIHALVTLPLVARLLAGVRPGRWASAMAPALLTAFSTSSSSATLPVTIESAEDRGGVDHRTASFVLPLGATINMDGTALYECVATIFLAQYYASSAGYELTLTRQLIVVVTALLASIGAAGIPSAGLVMMTIILTALELPLEGALLLLAVDRPLDMLRTTVNVWSDSIGAAVIHRVEEGAPPCPRVSGA